MTESGERGAPGYYDDGMGVVCHGCGDYVPCDHYPMSDRPSLRSAVLSLIGQSQPAEIERLHWTVDYTGGWERLGPRPRKHALLSVIRGLEDDGLVARTTDGLVLTGRTALSGSYETGESDNR